MIRNRDRDDSYLLIQWNNSSESEGEGEGENQTYKTMGDKPDNIGICISNYSLFTITNLC